jgi:hypothetical protein
MVILGKPNCWEPEALPHQWNLRCCCCTLHTAGVQTALLAWQQLKQQEEALLSPAVVFRRPDAAPLRYWHGMDYSMPASIACGVGTTNIRMKADATLCDACHWHQRQRNRLQVRLTSSSLLL